MKCEEDAIPIPLKKKKAYLCVNILKFYTTCFYGMPSWGLSEHI